MRPDDAILIQQRQLSLHFEHALDDEHHIGPPGVIFIEAQTYRMLNRPGQDPFAEFGDLLAFLQHDGVLADQIDAADMAVQVHTHARPIQPRGDLLDMGGLPGAMIALHENAPVVSEAGQDRQGRLAIEHIGRIQVGHIFVRLGKSRNAHGHVQAERVAHIDHHVRRGCGIKTIHRHASFHRFGGADFGSGEAASPGWVALCALSETCRPEMAVGLDDLPQPLFCAPVSAVGVGVKAFHEFLIPGLYLVQGRVVLEIKNRQRVKLRFG